MSKFHEAAKNAKKAPKKNLKEKKAEKRAKKMFNKEKVHSLKVFEEKETQA